MSSLNILALANIILLVSLMLFLIYVAYGHHNYHFIQAQDDVIFLETFEDDVIFLETFEGTLKVENVENVTGPTIHDPNLAVETVFEGIAYPTSMAFLGPDDILVLEKNNGTVRRIVNGNMLEEPLLDVNVANREYRGLLGIAIKTESKGIDESTVYVFLYYTENNSRDGEDVQDVSLLGNRLYRYELDNNKLINPILLLDIPGKKGADHNGGVVVIGPDQHVYLITGDRSSFNQAQNILNGSEPNGTSAIIRITQDGKAIQDNKNLGDEDPLNKYYAYGIRNSFGMDFDPVTGNLWDTENGREFGDEINLVEPGFNSGWRKVQGIWELNETKNRIGIFDEHSKGQLVDFDGKGKYSSPEFIWNDTAAPSALKFFNSDKLGKQYENDIFVGDYRNGYLYHFDLNENRTNLLLGGPLKDKIADTPKELQKVIFGQGFEGITDIELGPDGYLYVLAQDQNEQGAIIKVQPKN
jgi:glucose/arabinose dehydrogenase